MIQKEIFWGSMVPTLHCLFILKFNLKYLNNFPIYILYNLMHLSLFYDLHETAFQFTFCYIFQFLFFQFIKQKKNQQIVYSLPVSCECSRRKNRGKIRSWAKKNTQSLLGWKPCLRYRWEPSAECMDLFELLI